MLFRNMQEKLENVILFIFTASSPVITNPPQNQTALDGKEATIACEAAGAPAPNVTWYFNDGQISFSGRLEILEDGSLLISNVR
jgi:protein sidekick